MFEGWKNWSLQDIIRILKDTKSYGFGVVEMGNIVLRKLLEAAVHVPFMVIEETVHKALETTVYAKNYDDLNGFSVFNGRTVCDFFKEFVKCGIDDARYYYLSYTMLTYLLNGVFPLGFEMAKKDVFNSEVLAKLPSKIQKQLKSYTFYKDDKDTDRRIGFAIPF